MQIYVMNADGTNSRRLGYSPADDWRPAWSPDGRLIAFISTRLGSQAIYLMNADGTNPRRLSHDSVEDSDPAWSPDGRFIAFRSKSAEGSRYIYVMNADGSNPHQVGNDADAYFPAWWSSQRLPGGHPNCSG
jgi:TolB protein